MENLVSLKKCKWHLKAGKLRVTAIVLLEKEEEKEGGEGECQQFTYRERV